MVGLPDEGAPGAVAFDTGTDPRSQVRGSSGAAGQPQFNPTTRPHATAERSGGAADEQEGRRDRRGGGRQPGSDILVDLVTPIFLSLLGIAVLFMYNSGMIQFGSDSGDDSYASPFGLGFDGEEADGRQIRPQQLAVQIDLAQAFAGATVKVRAWQCARAAPRPDGGFAARAQLPVTRQEVCPVCSGNGADPAHGLRKVRLAAPDHDRVAEPCCGRPAQCSRCGGRGHQVMHQQIGPFVQRVSVECVPARARKPRRRGLLTVCVTGAPCAEARARARCARARTARARACCRRRGNWRCPSRRAPATATSWCAARAVLHTA